MRQLLDWVREFDAYQKAGKPAESGKIPPQPANDGNKNPAFSTLFAKTPGTSKVARGGLELLSELKKKGKSSVSPTLYHGCIRKEYAESFYVWTAWKAAEFSDDREVQSACPFTHCDMISAGTNVRRENADGKVCQSGKS